MTTTPVFLPGKSHGQKSLAGYSPRGHKDSDTAERAHTHVNICLGGLCKERCVHGLVSTPPGPKREERLLPAFEQRIN